MHSCLHSFLLHSFLALPVQSCLAESACSVDTRGVTRGALGVLLAELGGGAVWRPCSMRMYDSIYTPVVLGVFAYSNQSTNTLVWQVYSPCACFHTRTHHVYIQTQSNP